MEKCATKFFYSVVTCSAEAEVEVEIAAENASGNRWQNAKLEPKIEFFHFFVTK